MTSSDVNPEKLRKLTEVFRELGADDPEALARSQFSEGIAKLTLSPQAESAHPARRLVEFVLLLAIRDRVTEIRFEPYEAGYHLSVRIDDADYELMPPNRDLAGRIGQIFKAIADLDICNHRTLQTGRVQIGVGLGVAEFGILVEPIASGERVVATILHSTVAFEEAELILRAWGMDDDGSCPLGYTEEEQRPAPDFSS